LNLCPFQEKCNVFKGFLQEKISVHNPFIKPNSRKIEIGDGWKKIGDEWERR
jgi:hypothetical protein